MKPTLLTKNMTQRGCRSQRRLAREAACARCGQIWFPSAVQRRELRPQEETGPGRCRQDQRRLARHVGQGQRRGGKAEGHQGGTARVAMALARALPRTLSRSPAWRWAGLPHCLRGLAGVWGPSFSSYWIMQPSHPFCQNDLEAAVWTPLDRDSVSVYCAAVPPLL